MTWQIHSQLPLRQSTATLVVSIPDTISCGASTGLRQPSSNICHAQGHTIIATAHDGVIGFKYNRYL